MDLGAVIGLLIGVSGIMMGFLEEAHFNFRAIFGLFVPAAGFIVMGGTIGALVLSTPMTDLKMFPEMLRKVFFGHEHDALELIEKVTNIADKSRREGLLSLEKEIGELDNELMRRGLSLVVDGVDPNTIREIMLKAVEISEFKCEVGIKMFEKMGGYSPTMGVIGTVMGMVNILANMSGDTAELGKSISVAFIATFYGVFFANVVYLPCADRLKGKMARENMIDEIVIEGVLSIQAGENPRVIKEKLNYTMFERMAGKKPEVAPQD